MVDQASQDEGDELPGLQDESHVGRLATEFGMGEAGEVVAYSAGDAPGTGGPLGTRIGL
jgi:hypothetical protein